MKNINYYKKNINKAKITILGCGKSGLAAANLGNYLGAKVFISDNRKNLNKNQLIHFLPPGNKTVPAEKTARQP